MTFFKNEIDILVNNTQGPPAGDVLNVDINDYQNAFDLLFKNIVYTTMLAIKICIKISGEELLISRLFQ